MSNCIKKLTKMSVHKYYMGTGTAMYADNQGIYLGLFICKVPPCQVSPSHLGPIEFKGFFY